MIDKTSPRRWAAGTAVAGTVFIAAGAFWLSFTSLADLAARSGIGAGQAWAWPLIVDGIIVVATVAVVALAGTRVAWYPWLLLICGAGLSVTANSIHAIVAADADVPAVLAACVAAVPPLVLLAITHLTIVLNRHRKSLLTVHALSVPEVMTTPEPALTSIPAAAVAREHAPIERDGTAPTSGHSVPTAREAAEVLRAGGWSNKKIARYLEVHPSTVGRWFANDTDQPGETTGDSPEAEPMPSPGDATSIENEEEPS